MKKTNKLLLSLLTFISIILFPMQSNASSGSLNISGTSTAVVGNTVTINITLTSKEPLGAWEFDVNYDSNLLKLTSSNAENNGTYFVNAGNGSMKSKTYTLKFRALKSGSTNITIGGYDIYAYDTSKMSITKSNKKVTIMTQQELEATYSKDNYLKSLSVEGYELDKPFDKETTEYTVNVPTGTTSVKINASVNDSRSNINGGGETTVSEGLNTIPIVVTAQNGSEKTYTLTINVEDQNPINVTIDNNDYIIVKTASLLEAPATFTETTLTIEGLEVPAFINELANITLVGLKSSDGKINLYEYKEGKYSKYNEMNLNHLLLLPIPFDKELDFTKTKTDINGEEVATYKYSDKSNIVIINAKSLIDGETNYYLYDTKNNTAILYDEELITLNNSTLKLYTYVIIAFASVCLLMFLIIISLLHSSKKKQKKLNKFIERQEAKIEATRKLNDVVNEVQKITAEENKQNKENKKEEESESPQKTEIIKEEFNSERASNKELKVEQVSKYENAELTSILEALNTSKEDLKDNLEINKSDLTKKELKELKKIEKQKAKEEKKNKKKSQNEIPENSLSNDNKGIDIIKEDTEEVYDLFEDDKKKKKK